MNLKEELISLLDKVRIEDNYQNPHLISAVLAALDEIYGYNDPVLDKWLSDMWSA